MELLDSFHGYFDIVLNNEQVKMMAESFSEEIYLVEGVIVEKINNH